MQKYLHYNCIKLGNINNLQIQEISRKKLKKLAKNSSACNWLKLCRCIND